MHKSKLVEERIVGALREMDRHPVMTMGKRHGVSEQTIYMLKKWSGTLQLDDFRRSKLLEVENTRLEMFAAERDLEIEVMKGIAADKLGVTASRAQVSCACTAVNRNAARAWQAE
jgi:putative transposase